MPRYNIEWTAYERAMFQRFEHANDLAEALFEKSQRGFEAFCAMNSSLHFTSQVAWFSNSGFFFKLRPPMAILRQEELANDLTDLLRRLGVSSAISLADDPVRSHRNPYHDAPELSDKARNNLRIWFAQDYLFYDYCNAWIEHFRGAKRDLNSRSM